MVPSYFCNPLSLLITVIFVHLDSECRADGEPVLIALHAAQAGPGGDGL